MATLQTKFGNVILHNIVWLPPLITGVLKRISSASCQKSKYWKSWNIAIWLGLVGCLCFFGTPALAQNGNGENADPAAPPKAPAEEAPEKPKAEGFWKLSDKERLRDEFPARPTPFEVTKIRDTVDSAFQQFIQLWAEERYFELYEWGKKQSRDFITPEEFATRMVKLDWVPVGLIEEEPFQISFRFRTFIYVEASLKFRHKTKASLQFQKRQTFLLLWENGRWSFDLLQMLRSPFYTPFQQTEQK
ncbi:MAG: hypothetical protein HQM14_17825 [SAR324 cluster bacterium]|nr:hypothetical protein [SAR324 cluster bacterium]